MKHSLQKLSENIQNEEEEGDTNASSTCKICIEPISTHNKFNNSNHCAHPFCVDCIAKYIELKVENHEAMIGCPELNCKQVLDPLWCRAIISESVFAKWCDVLCDNYVLGFEKSYCPNRNCRELVVNECGGEVKKSKCPNCKELFCFGCKLRWHAGYRCEESKNLRDHNDILFGQLVERNAWVICPACGYCLERTQGCNVIKCRCNTHLCYKCGKKLEAASSFRCNCGYRNVFHLPFEDITATMFVKVTLLCWCILGLYYILHK